MSEALRTDIDYRVTKTPTYCKGEPTPGLAVGDVVRVTPSYATPDHDGDVRVKKGTASGRYVLAACLAPVVPASDFPVGTRVRVAADAKTTEGYAVYFGAEVEGVIVEAMHRPTSGNVEVRAVDQDGDDKVQYVDPQYLTKLDDVKPEAPTGVAEAALRKAAALIGGVDDVEKLIGVAKAIQEGV
ncbi:hypothetical protein SEA_MAGUCO_38 [Arthrobacter phage MaGuCo]|uniref:Uncharacterized protein n=1 Tax=Arthrobacter phage MaGuCo TaxID=3038363 RepID=A0AAF0GFT6_9CAUD|nr:hypothetical protein SEA_MAGUCO_38 [Arthrobacter phage MaGuCo]